jgi:hypothetical protein
VVKQQFDKAGFVVLPHDHRVLAWSQAACRIALDVLTTPGDLRHGRTWRVGVDELPNLADGSIGGVALDGAWVDLIDAPGRWHQAQLSVVFPGYPQQDSSDTDAAHGYRLRRDAAHVDGLLPEGPQKRRHLREPHSFVLGIPLNYASASPLVVWPGSHVIMHAAFTQAFANVPADNYGDIDVTDTYQSARRQVFGTCERTEVPVIPGQATLLHRHLLHGMAPWGHGTAPAEGRMIAYFRPQTDSFADWL